MTSIQDDRELDSNSSLSTYVTKIKALQDWVNGIISKYGFIGDEYKVSTAFLKQYDTYIDSEVLSGKTCELPYAVSGTMIKSGNDIYFQIPADSDTYYRLINWYNDEDGDGDARFSSYTVADGIRNYLCFIIQCKDDKGGCFHGKIDLSNPPDQIKDDKGVLIKWSFKVSDNNFNLSKSGPIYEYFKDNPDITELKFNKNLLLTIAPSIKDFKGLVTFNETKDNSSVTLDCYTTKCLTGDDSEGWYDIDNKWYPDRKSAAFISGSTTITTSIKLNISPITSSTITDLVFPPFFYKQNKGFDSNYNVIHKGLERIYINWYENEKNSSGISSEWVSNDVECTTAEGYPLLDYYTYSKCPSGGGSINVGITVALPSCISDFSNWVDKLLTYNGSPKDKEDKAPEEGAESSEDFYVLRLDPVESDDGKELIIDCGDGIDEDKKEVIGKVSESDKCTAQIYTDDQPVSGETYPYGASSSPANPDEQTNS